MPNGLHVSGLVRWIMDVDCSGRGILGIEGRMEKEKEKVWPWV